MVVNTTNGTVEQSIEYDSFGNILSDSNPNFQPFTLAGGIYDNDTKLTRFGARDYDAREGRWTSKDPIKFDGGRNFYVYAENNPIILIDKTGLEPYKLYNSEEEAGIEGLKDIFCKSVSLNSSTHGFEHGYPIIKTKDGYYYYGDIVISVYNDRVNPFNNIKDRKFSMKEKVKSDGHSHGDDYYYDKGNEVFSSEFNIKNPNFYDGDRGTYDENSANGYLVTPSGMMWKYVFPGKVKYLGMLDANECYCGE